MQEALTERGCCEIQERLGCVTDEPCCFEELAKASEHYRFASPSWMRKCLRQVRLDGLGAKATAEIVTSMLRDFYIAPDLVKDTLKSDRTVIGRHNGTAQVHVLRADVDAAIRLALRDSQLRGSDGDGDDGLSYSAFSFHYGMADALRLLQDPNSRYDTPFGDWTLHRVVQLRPRRQPTGETEFVLADGPGWGRANGLNEEIYKRVHGVDPPRLLAYANKPVTHVNGIPVEKYLQTNADQLAAGRSSGTRLNWLLALGSTGEPLSLSSIRPPAVDEETFSFGGNIKATWKLTVRHRGTASVRANMGYGSRFPHLAEPQLRLRSALSVTNVHRKQENLLWNPSGALQLGGAITGFA